MLVGNVKIRFPRAVGTICELMTPHTVPTARKSKDNFLFYRHIVPTARNTPNQLAAKLPSTESNNR